jgi:hypothetical protein
VSLKAISLFVFFIVFTSSGLKSKVAGDIYIKKAPLKMIQPSQNVKTEEELERLQNKDKLEQTSQEITITKNRQIWLVLITAITVILVSVLIVMLRQFIKNRATKIQILELETNLMQTELELLQIKNEAAKQTVKSSEKLQRNIQSIIENLRQSDISKNPEIIEIRQDLERLISVSFQAKPAAVRVKSDMEIYENLKSQYPELSNLNDTAVQILLLSIKDATPKFISHEMKLNVQYVRNVRSSLKALINTENTERWQWTDIRLFPTD